MAGWLSVYFLGICFYWYLLFFPLLCCPIFSYSFKKLFNLNFSIEFLAMYALIFFFIGCSGAKNVHPVPVRVYVVSILNCFILDLFHCLVPTSQI